MKNKGKILWGILISAVGGYCLMQVNKNIYNLWNANSIKVIADAPLIPAKVKIEFGNSVNTISRETDRDLFKNRNKYKVLFDGEAQEQMSNDYGENDFLITYDNRYYFFFRHFKFNCNHQHGYYFHFFRKNDQIFIQVDIKGEDAMAFEEPLLDTSLLAK